MEYFSRAREVEILSELTTGCAPQPVVVVGPRGFGKSILLRELTASSTMPVISMRGSEAEESWPYAGITALLSGLDSVLDTDSFASLPELLDTELQATPLAISRRLADSIRSVRQEPFLVVIDDADLLDPVSQQILGYVIRRSGMSEMRVVLTLTSLSAESPFDGLHQLTLEPLAICELLELGRSLRNTATSISTLEHVARASGGSPLAFLDVLSELPERVLMGKAPFPIAMRTGPRLSQLIDRELSRLSPAARATLDRLSTAEITPVDLFDRIEGTSREALDELFAADVVRQENGHLHIVSEPVRWAVYRALSARTRLSIHAEIGRDAAQDHPALSIWHASYTEHDPSHSPTLLAAAREFAEQGRIRVAVDFTERGLALNSDGDLSALLGRLSWTLLLEANLHLARRYLHMARGHSLDVAVPPELATVSVVLDHIQCQELVPRIVELSVDTYGPTDPIPCTRLLSIAAICHLERWELEEATTLVARAAALDGHDATVVQGMTALVAAYDAALTGRPLPDGCSAISPSPAFQAAFGIEHSRILAARVLSLAEQYGDARSVLQDVTGHAPHVNTLWTLLALQVEFANEVRAGQYHRAREAFAQIDLFHRSQSHFVLNHAHMAAMLALLDGERDAATETVHSWIRQVTPYAGAAQEAKIVILQGRIAMSRHDVERAAEYFYRARHVAGTLRNPQLLRFHIDFIASLVRADRWDAAREILAEFRTDAQLMPSAWSSRALAICEALLREGEEALPALRSVLETWQDSEHEFLRARALYLLAHLQDRQGEQQQAEESVRRAREIFREIGVEVRGTPCAPDEEPRSPTPRLDLLSEKEQAVVELLVTGAKNQAIARELFISVRAVELRLTNIFRKLGVTSRFDVTKILAGELDARRSRR